MIMITETAATRSSDVTLMYFTVACAPPIAEPFSRRHPLAAHSLQLFTLIACTYFAARSGITFEAKDCRETDSSSGIAAAKENGVSFGARTARPLRFSFVSRADGLKTHTGN